MFQQETATVNHTLVSTPTFMTVETQSGGFTTQTITSTITQTTSIPPTTSTVTTTADSTTTETVTSASPTTVTTTSTTATATVTTTPTPPAQVQVSGSSTAKIGVLSGISFVSVSNGNSYPGQLSGGSYAVTLPNMDTYSVTINYMIGPYPQSCNAGNLVLSVAVSGGPVNANWSC